MAERSLVAGLKEWRQTTDNDSAIDYGVSLAISGRMNDLIAELPVVVDAGVATCKAFMVFDFRIDAERLFDAMRVMGERGGMLQVHCEDPVVIDSAIASALQHGDTAPRYHAAMRPSYAEGVATARVMAFARATGAPVHVVHLSSSDALRHVREAKTLGLPVSAETCPHYLALTEARYGAADDLEVAKFMISPPLRSTTDQAAMWTGLADGSLDLIATDHVPDRAAVEKADATKGVPFNEISNGAPGIETLLAIGYSEGVAKQRLTVERLVDLISTTPARRFGLPRKGALEPGFDADVVLFDPKARRTMAAANLHHTSDYTPYEGLEIAGAVRSVFVRGSAVIRDGAFVGTRGFGQFVERGSPAT